MFGALLGTIVDRVYAYYLVGFYQQGKITVSHH